MSAGQYMLLLISCFLGPLNFGCLQFFCFLVVCFVSVLLVAVMSTENSRKLVGWSGEGVGNEPNLGSTGEE